MTKKEKFGEELKNLIKKYCKETLSDNIKMVIKESRKRKKKNK